MSASRTAASPVRTGSDRPLSAAASPDRSLSVAILAAGDVIEDWLDPIGVSLESFRREMLGSWVFGYMIALQRAGVRPSLICISARAGRPHRTVHEPTGAELYFVPPSPGFLRVRGAVESLGGTNGTLRRRLLQGAAAYWATPALRLARILRNDGFDALLVQDYSAPRFDACVAMARSIGIPVFGTFQGGTDPRGKLRRLLHSRSMSGAAGVIASASSQVEMLRTVYRLPPSKVARIFDPLDTDFWRPLGGERAAARRELGIPANARVAVWHGAISVEWKGLDVLLDAWKLVSEGAAAADLRLLILGTGPDSSAFRRRLEAERPAGVIWVDRWSSDRVEVRRYLAAGDVYVFPSRLDGFPVAPMEAMACGLPVVATDAPGIRDMFEEGEAHGGIVFRRGDAAGVAGAVERLLQDTALRLELGSRARRRAEAAFSLDAIGSQLRNFLLEHRRGT